MGEKRSRWQKIRKSLGVVGITAVCVLVVGLIVAIIGGYHSNWEWTGFNSGTSQITITSTSNVNYTATIPQPSKTLWDWLQLLGVLLVPLMIGVFTIVSSIQQSNIAADQQREETLETYLDKMSDLLTNKDLNDPLIGGEIREIILSRTLTVLHRLDSPRIAVVLQFLLKSNAILKGRPIISLSSLVLIRPDLDGIDLSEADLSGAKLTGAILHNAILSATNLAGTDLSRSDLRGANLRKADLAACDLSGVDLSGASLTNADLSGADLSGADVTKEQLAEANSLKGAIMPDGSKHP